MTGRIEEQKYLQSLLDEEEPQFVAVFGRHRIGKTFLVRESFGYSFTFEHTGNSNRSIEEASQKQTQLDTFAASLKEYGFEREEPLESWSEAFDSLKELIKRSKDKKKVIFIDELSWMDTKRSGFLTALESFWNGWATARKEKDIILIVCASATYWMIDNIVNAKGGLHNRLTGQIYLQPFTLGECREYLDDRNIKFSTHQILQCYMILGGVPYYWSLLKKGKSLPQNIDEIFFRQNAPLALEYENLYRALFNKPDQYLKIIETLSRSQKGISRTELSIKAGIPSSGDFSKKLQELENCGFIRKYLPYGCKINECLYQLIDNFTLFYHKFMKDNFHEEHFWETQMNSPAINSWAGLAFEKVCLEHIPQVKKALGISGVSAAVNAWECKADPENGIRGSQIDLLIARKDQVINICEMKYSETGFIVDAAFDRDMKRKMEDFRKKTKTKHALHATLVTTYAVDDTPYANELQSVLTAEDLFS